MPTIDEAIERALAAQIYAVVVHPAEFPRDDAYCIMQAPDFIVQVGGDFDDSDAANAVCERLNMRAALSASLADVPVSEAMARAGLNAYHSGEHVLGIYPEMCAKLAEEFNNGRP